jgi:GMP synthase-like glutamine amidotransferase
MLYIIQNDPEVPPGNLLDQLAIPYVVLHPYRGDNLPPVNSISAMIVMGGAMGANDDQRYPFLIDLKQLIRKVIAANIPYLGICLGGQLLAAALGAPVVSHRWQELGTMTVLLTLAGEEDHLFSGIAETFITFQWHNDSFDIPAGGVLLASSALCQHQAFRVGNSAWGLQFHPEVTEAIIRDWCAWDHATAVKVESLVGCFRAAALPYSVTARQLLSNFLLYAGLHNVQ